MFDLFGGGLEHIPLEGADVSILRHLDLSQAPSVLLDTLIQGTPWRQEEIVVWGKRHLQPRLVAWYGDAGNAYTYSGITLDPLPWTPILLDIRMRVEQVVGEQFNTVLLNYYRDGRDSMGFHSDDEPELGRNPTIASLSLGEERTFVFRARRNKYAKRFKIRLASGSLMIMRGTTQVYWQHGIEKENRTCMPRVNLTFRRILRRL